VWARRQSPFSWTHREGAKQRLNNSLTFFSRRHFSLFDFLQGNDHQIPDSDNSPNNNMSLDRRIHPSSDSAASLSQVTVMQQPQSQQKLWIQQQVTGRSDGTPVTQSPKTTSSNSMLISAAVATANHQAPSFARTAAGGLDSPESMTGRSGRSFSMSIMNAHEFAPHPSIRCLTTCDTLLVQEDYSSPFAAFSREHRYKVHNRSGQLLFIATEETTGCLFKQVRPFEIHVTDAKGEEVILVTKDCSCGVIHCANEVKVYSPPDNLIGTVSEGCGFIHPSYHLIDATSPEVPMFEISGPVCTCSCFCDDVDFPVFQKGGKGIDAKVGFISKKWGGILREVFTTSDAFGVTFPQHFDPKYKVLFLAACFLIVSNLISVWSPCIIIILPRFWEKRRICMPVTSCPTTCLP
jgi:hypothetical protein